MTTQELEAVNCKRAQDIKKLVEGQVFRVSDKNGDGGITIRWIEDGSVEPIQDAIAKLLLDREEWRRRALANGYRTNVETVGT
jgi:hypothetical protein